MPMVFPPKEILGKFHIAPGGFVYPREGVEPTDRELELMLEYEKELQDCEKRRLAFVYGEES